MFHSRRPLTASRRRLLSQVPQISQVLFLPGMTSHDTSTARQGSTRSSSVLRRHRLALWLVGASILLGFCFLGLSLAGELLIWTKSVDHGATELLVGLDEPEMGKLMRLYALLCPAIGVLLAAFVWLRERAEVRSRLWVKNAAFTVSSSVLLFGLLTRLGSVSSWYPLDTILTAPETLDVFGRRLLLVWPASWLYSHIEGLTALRVYYVMQGAAIVATMILTGIWAARFAGWRNAHLGQLLLVVMISPTFVYHNYYDILIVGTFTAALLCLWDRKYVAFTAVVGIGTLNHENTLLLAFVAAAVCYRRETAGRCTAIVGGAVAAWLVAKTWISIQVPMHASVHLRVMTNLWDLAREHRDMAVSMAALSTMILLTAFGWESASPVLRRSAVLIFPLLGVTFLFGKFREARQFDAFIPLAIAFALSALSKPDGEATAASTHGA